MLVWLKNVIVAKPNWLCLGAFVIGVIRILGIIIMFVSIVEYIPHLNQFVINVNYVNRG